MEAVVVTALGSFINTLQKGFDVVHRNSFPGAVGIDPDAPLVEEARNGSIESFEELIGRHSSRLYQTLLAVTGNIEEAQDAMQDTFLRALIHIGSFQGRSKFSTWLTSIATNVALQRLRDNKRLESLGEASEEVEFHLLPGQAWGANPEELYLEGERCRLVQNGLMKVPAKYRAVLVLRDIEQVSTAEAAAVLGLSVSAMKARLHRGRKMLYEALMPYFV